MSSHDEDMENYIQGAVQVLPDGTYVPLYRPEKLSFWERLFHRTRREVYNRGRDEWGARSASNGVRIEGSEYWRSWVEYCVIDRLTGTVMRIEREYLT